MHLEYSPDLLVVAGDLEPIRQASIASFVNLCTKHTQVIYVPGNHDYYGSSWQRVEDLLRTFEGSIDNLKILRSGDVFTYQGRRFLGDTMWIRDVPGIYSQQGMINDPYQILDFYSGMKERHARFMAFIDKELQKGDIVITHHLPSDRSTPAIFQNSPSQPWFVCDMENLIHERKPAAWIHGHTHSRHVYALGETQIICNAIGYPSELGENNWHRLEPSTFEI
jgi:Icc-related predicted phosphoesterase